MSRIYKLLIRLRTTIINPLSLLALSFLFPSPALAQPLGPVAPPPGVSRYGDLTNGGLVNFMTAILRTMLVMGAIFSLLNFIMAGYQYMSAANDPKALQGAWGRIWQSLLGLVISFGAFILAAVFGYILTKDPTFILRPRLYGPN